MGRLLVDRGAIDERYMLVEALGEDIFEFNYAHLDTIVSLPGRLAKKAGMKIPMNAIRGKGFTFAD